MKQTKTELLVEIANCNEAIKAFEIGMKWLAPGDLAEAPSIQWLKMHRHYCCKKARKLREG